MTSQDGLLRHERLPIRRAGTTALFCLVLAVGAVGCTLDSPGTSPGASSGPVETGEPVVHRLTILHSSEHHGAALPLEVRRGGRDSQPVGGMASRATLVKAIRSEVEHVLLVDSGDILIGTALSSFFRGEPDIKAMNLMGYQAMTAGNHDFDFGLDHLRHLSKLAAFPILCSNVTGRHVTLPCHPFTLVRAGGLSIGLIGLLGHSNFPATFNRQVVAELVLQDPVDTARRLAGELKSTGRADLV
ncbi:MAG: hypothetical protein ACREI3_02950, partial [Nitrospirales bacterium]